MSVKKSGSEFFVEVSSGQREFGATGFKTIVRNLATGISTTLSGDATEEIETIASAKESTVGASATTGEKTVAISNGGTLEDGMVFDDGAGNKYYIEEINATTITLRKALVADIAFGATLTEVGNTGIYLVPVTIATAGQYGIRISNPGLNMRIKEIQVAVEDVILTDVNDAMVAGFTAINTQLDQIQNSVENADESNFTVYSS